MSVGVTVVAVFVRTFSSPLNPEIPVGTDNGCLCTGAPTTPSLVV